MLKSEWLLYREFLITFNSSGIGSGSGSRASLFVTRSFFLFILFFFQELSGHLVPARDSIDGSYYPRDGEARVRLLRVPAMRSSTVHFGPNDVLQLLRLRTQ